MHSLTTSQSKFIREKFLDFQQFNKLSRPEQIELVQSTRLKIEDLLTDPEFKPDEDMSRLLQQTLGSLDQFNMTIEDPGKIPTPKQLSFEVLPQGEGFEPLNNDSSQNNTERIPEDFERVRWAFEIASAFDATFDPQQHFSISQLGSKESSGRYHVIELPGCNRCIFVANEYGNATYIVPRESWQYWAKNHKIEDLREAAKKSKEEPENPSVPHIYWFPMLKNEEQWRARLILELTDLLVTGNNEPKQIVESSGRMKRTFEEWLSALIKFINEHEGEMPSQSSLDAEEIRLYYKIKSLRQGYKNQRLLKSKKEKELRGEPLTHEEQKINTYRLSKINETRILAAGIILDSEAYYERKFQDDLKAIIEINKNKGRFPTRYSSDPEEKRLGIRIRFWRLGFKNERIIKDKEARGEVFSDKEKKELFDSRLSPEYEAQLLAAGIDLYPKKRFSK